MASTSTEEGKRTDATESLESLISIKDYLFKESEQILNESGDETENDESISEVNTVAYTMAQFYKY